MKIPYYSLKQMGKAIERYLKKSECPECEGINLNEDHTICFDCQQN